MMLRRNRLLVKRFGIKRAAPASSLAWQRMTLIHVCDDLYTRKQEDAGGDAAARGGPGACLRRSCEPFHTESSLLTTYWSESTLSS